MSGLQGQVATVYVDAETGEPLVLIKNLGIGDPMVTGFGGLPFYNDPMEDLKYLYKAKLVGPMIFGLVGIWALGGLGWAFAYFRAKTKVDWSEVVTVGLDAAFVIIMLLELGPAYSKGYVPGMGVIPGQL